MQNRIPKSEIPKRPLQTLTSNNSRQENSLSSPISKTKKNYPGISSCPKKGLPWREY